MKRKKNVIFSLVLTVLFGFSFQVIADDKDPKHSDDKATLSRPELEKKHKDLTRKYQDLINELDRLEKVEFDAKGKKVSIKASELKSIVADLFEYRLNLQEYCWTEGSHDYLRTYGKKMDDLLVNDSSKMRGLLALIEAGTTTDKVLSLDFKDADEKKKFWEEMQILYTGASEYYEPSKKDDKFEGKYRLDRVRSAKGFTDRQKLDQDTADKKHIESWAKFAEKFKQKRKINLKDKAEDFNEDFLKKFVENEDQKACIFAKAEEKEKEEKEDDKEDTSGPPGGNKEEPKKEEKKEEKKEDDRDPTEASPTGPPEDLLAGLKDKKPTGPKGPAGGGPTGQPRTPVIPAGGSPLTPYNPLLGLDPFNRDRDDEIDDLRRLIDTLALDLLNDDDDDDDNNLDQLAQARDGQNGNGGKNGQSPPPPPAPPAPIAPTQQAAQDSGGNDSPIPPFPQQPPQFPQGGNGGVSAASQFGQSTGGDSLFNVRDTVQAKPYRRDESRNADRDFQRISSQNQMMAMGALNQYLALAAAGGLGGLYGGVGGAVNGAALGAGAGTYAASLQQRLGGLSTFGAAAASSPFTAARQGSNAGNTAAQQGAVSGSIQNQLAASGARSVPSRLRGR